MVVNPALENDLFEEADMVCYAKLFSNHLCQQGNCKFEVFLFPGTVFCLTDT